MKYFLKYFLSRHDVPNSSYKEQLDRESLKSEVYRVYVLIAVIIFFIIYLLFVSLFYSKEYNPVNESTNVLFFSIVILFILLFREVMVKRVFERIIHSGKSMPSYVKYVNSFIEVSFPTLATVAFAQVISPIYTLVSPIAFTYFIFIILSTVELDEVLCLFVSFVAAVEYVAVSLYYVSKINISPETILLHQSMLYYGKGVMLLLSGFISAFVANQLRKRIIGSLQILEERNRIEKLFGQQVSKAVVSELLVTKKEIIGLKRSVCIMFLDIRDYFKFAIGKEPEEIIKYQNDMFSFMIDIIIKHNGIVNQIMGDGFMASFGAPISYENDCLDAVNAAKEILAMLKIKNEKQSIPFTRVGIGIHTGEAVTGNVGTSSRKQYSITGNVVIIASRIEQLNKEYGSSLLISEEVLKKVKGGVSNYERLGEASVKGSPAPINIIKIA